MSVPGGMVVPMTPVASPSPQVPALQPLSRAALTGPRPSVRPAAGPSPTVTHAPYRREPYVRCRTPSSVVDGKAAAWTRTSVLLHWIDDSGRAHNRWVPAEAVQRIRRDESSWQDPYDDWSFYYPANPAPRIPVAA